MNIKEEITKEVNNCFYYQNGYTYEKKENIVPAIVNRIINYIEEEKSKAVLEAKVFTYEEIIKKSNFKTVIDKKTKEVEE